MRIPSLLLATAGLLLVALPTSAYHDSGGGESGHMCPTYTQHAALTDGYSIDWNEKGQFLLAWSVPEEIWGWPLTMYVASDAPNSEIATNGQLLSMWHYQETNGEPGLQRGDEVCDQASGWPGSDTLAFF